MSNDKNINIARIDKIILSRAVIEPNESLRELLLDSISDKNKSPPRGYYWLTGLCDPVKDYLGRIHPKLSEKISPDQEKLMVRGTKIHKFAEIWIKNMDNYFSSESKLDGFSKGVRTIGKIDAKVDNKIIEFKSKIQIPLTIEEVVKKYPQDIEQLAFYIALDSTCSDKGYLVFISQDMDQDMKVLKVVIKDREKVLSLMKQRVNLLDGVLKEKIDSKLLGKCRHCNPEECVFSQEKLCKWVENESSCGVLNFVEITEEEEFKDKLISARSKWDKTSEIFSIYDIISARKTLYSNSLEKLDRNWTEPIEKTLAKDYSFHMALNLVKKHSSKLENFPPRSISDIQKNKSWIKIPTCKDNEGKLVPYVTGASITDNEWYFKNLPTHLITKLGIICAIYKKSNGYIFEYLPNSNFKVRAYEVSFRNPEEIVKEINKIVHNLKVNEIDRFNELPLCPDFFCKDCLIKEFCDNEQKIKK